MEEAYTKLVLTSHTLLDIAHKLQVPGSLPVPSTRDNNVEDARRILRWLRNLQHTSEPMEFWMRHGKASEQQIKADFLEKLILIYAGQVKIAQLSNPEALNHFTIEHANHASGSVAYSIALHTLEILPEGNSAIPVLDAQLDNILEEWDRRQAQSVEQLIDSIESGLTHLVNKPMGDRSPVDRLIEVSNNIQEAVRKLYELDTLGEPERIESIELAREILRRLKDLSFSDKQIAEALDPTQPNEKLAFAQRISEMVSMYKNLLFEAMRINPDVIHDVRVKNANDAANWCSNGVKMMAAKEMAIDSTSLQQISAELDKHGGDANFRNASLNKLMHKMEDGVEHAAQEISAQEKKEQKEQIESEMAAQTDDFRYKRRRRNQQSSNKETEAVVQKSNTAAQHEVIVTSIKMEAQTGVNSLNKVDIAAVKQAGSSLRKSNKQANDITAANKKLDKDAKAIAATSAVNVTDTNKITPDSRGFAAKERDSLNPNNPRNKPRIV